MDTPLSSSWSLGDYCVTLSVRTAAVEPLQVSDEPGTLALQACDDWLLSPCSCLFFSHSCIELSEDRAETKAAETTEQHGEAEAEVGVPPPGQPTGGQTSLFL